jgi:hypothetical protein
MKRPYSYDAFREEWERTHDHAFPKEKASEPPTRTARAVRSEMSSDQYLRTGMMLLSHPSSNSWHDAYATDPFDSETRMNSRLSDRLKQEARRLSEKLKEKTKTILSLLCTFEIANYVLHTVPLPSSELDEAIADSARSGEHELIDKWYIQFTKELDDEIWDGCLGQLERCLEALCKLCKASWLETACAYEAAATVPLLARASSMYTMVKPPPLAGTPELRKFEVTPFDAGERTPSLLYCSIAESKNRHVEEQGQPLQPPPAQDAVDTSFKRFALYANLRRLEAPFDVDRAYEANPEFKRDPRIWLRNDGGPNPLRGPEVAPRYDQRHMQFAIVRGLMASPAPAYNACLFGNRTVDGTRHHVCLKYARPPYSLKTFAWDSLFAWARPDNDEHQRRWKPADASTVNATALTMRNALLDRASCRADHKAECVIYPWPNNQGMRTAKTQWSVQAEYGADYSAACLYEHLIDRLRAPSRNELCVPVKDTYEAAHAVFKDYVLPRESNDANLNSITGPLEALQDVGGSNRRCLAAALKLVQLPWLLRCGATPGPSSEAHCHVPDVAEFENGQVEASTFSGLEGIWNNSVGSDQVSGWFGERTPGWPTPIAGDVRRFQSGAQWPDTRHDMFSTRLCTDAAESRAPEELHWTHIVSFLNDAQSEIDTLKHFSSYVQHHKGDEERMENDMFAARARIWQSALGELETLYDPVYSFFRMMAGTLHEPVEAVTMTNDNAEQMTRELQKHKDQIVHAMVKIEADIVNSFVQSALKTTPMNLRTDSTELRLHSEAGARALDVLQRSSAQVPYFQNAVSTLQLVTPSLESDVALSDLSRQVSRGLNSIQQKAFESFLTRQGRTLPVEALSRPSAVRFLALKPEAYAAVRSAFNYVERELALQHLTRPREQQNPSLAYKLIEGNETRLCNAFAELCAHKLAHSRVFSSSHASYISATAARTNATMLSIALQRVVRAYRDTMR